MEDSKFNKVPKDVLMLLALEFNFEDLLSFCATNKYTRYVCSSQQFWKNKLIRDYPEIELSQIKDFKAAYYHFIQNFKNESKAMAALTYILYLISIKMTNPPNTYYVNSYEQKILEKVANTIPDFPITTNIYTILEKLKTLNQKRLEQRISRSELFTLINEFDIDKFEYLNRKKDHIIFTTIVGTGLNYDYSKKKNIFPIKTVHIEAYKESGDLDYAPVILVKDSEIDYSKIKFRIDTRTLLPFEKNMKIVSILPGKIFTKVIIDNIILDVDYLDYFAQLSEAINLDWDVLEPSLDLFIAHKRLFRYIRITNAPSDINKNKKLQKLIG